MLEDCCEFGLLFCRKQGGISHYLMAMIPHAQLSLCIPPLDDGTDPPGGVAKQFSYSAWRFALLDLPQHVPMGPFYRILTLPIPLLKLFLCQVCLQCYSFCHTSILHYSDGFGISSGSPEIAADFAVSGSCWSPPHLGSAQLHRRWTGAPDRAEASVWLLLYRGFFVADGPCWWSGTVDGCPGSVDNRSLAGRS